MTDRADFERAIAARPDDYDLRLVYSDFLEENGFTREAKIQRDKAERKVRPPTPLEVRAMLSFSYVRMLPASWEKRFATDMYSFACKENGTLSERQRWWLWKLVHRYRRQIADGALIAEAKKHKDDPEPISVLSEIANGTDKAIKPSKPSQSRSLRDTPLPAWLTLPVAATPNNQLKGN